MYTDLVHGVCVTDLHTNEASFFLFLLDLLVTGGCNLKSGGGAVDQHLYRIGEVAQLTGANPKTIRYYDTIGLLSPAWVSDAGDRYYSTQEIWKLA